MPGPKTDPQHSIGTVEWSASITKPIVVGIYGLPGSGKTFIVNRLKQELGEEHFAFYEGSEVIDTIVPGGLDAFQKLEQQEKVQWRQLAIGMIRVECSSRGQIAVVAGHFMFWSEEEERGLPVYTQIDLDTYTHILYLNVPAEVIMQRRLDDTERSRPSTSISHLRRWQQEEETQLRRLCRDHRILFMVLRPTLVENMPALLRAFQCQTVEHDLRRAESKLDDAISAGREQLETVLVIDADRTLAADDTGILFWKLVSNLKSLKGAECALKTLFSSPLGYSYIAFRQAALLYEETVDDQEFELLCQEVASTVTIYPEFVSLLRLVEGQEHVGAVIVTCGLRRVWEKVLEREGLLKTVKVIGGGRIADGYVVTAAVKAALVGRLQDLHGLYVWAFGDSPLDVDMLTKADEAIVVVGEEQTRSQSMDTALMNAIDNKGLRARQVVLPSNASPRLDATKLPLAELTGTEFINSVLRRRNRVQVLLGTNGNAAKLLATPMRDSAVAGPMLREAHRRTGSYLATEYLAQLIGLEDCQISHVLGHYTSGYRLLHEQQTLIVALMRAGEPIAYGVNDVFPLAMLLHARHPADIEFHHLEGKRQVVLVDSVINSGKTVVEFVQAVRKLHDTISIAVVAGVVQTQCISPTSLIMREFADHSIVGLVALRCSDTKFTGSGTTDTGNRLFNTTHLK